MMDYDEPGPVYTEGLEHECVIRIPDQWRGWGNSKLLQVIGWVCFGIALILLGSLLPTSYKMPSGRTATLGLNIIVIVLVPASIRWFFYRLENRLCPEMIPINDVRIEWNGEGFTIFYGYQRFEKREALMGASWSNLAELYLVPHQPAISMWRSFPPSNLYRLHVKEREQIPNNTVPAFSPDDIYLVLNPIQVEKLLALIKRFRSGEFRSPEEERHPRFGTEEYEK